MGPDQRVGGHLIMTDGWFDEYTFRLVVDKKYVPAANAAPARTETHSPPRLGSALQGRGVSLHTGKSEISRQLRGRREDFRTFRLNDFLMKSIRIYCKNDGMYHDVLRDVEEV